MMAEPKAKDNQKKEMTDNERALVQYAIVGEYNENFRADTPRKITLKQVKNNHIVELLAVKSQTELMAKINPLQNYKANPLNSYTKEMLEILKPHFSLEGIELDLDTRKAKIISPFESWRTVEFPNAKKSGYTPSNVSIADVIDFLGHKGIDSLPNLYKLGVINSTKHKVKDLDSNAVKVMEELVAKVA